MLYSKTSNLLKITVAVSFSAALLVSPLALAEEAKPAAAADKTVTGEIVDMMCYVDHNGMGEKHASCAAKCIKSGGPVGILSEGKVYLVVGDHKPMNEQLAEHAGKTVTLKGKMASNGGVNMIENAEIVKQ
ncbi:MAG: hypothetical protein ABJB09_06295 [Verrucomicrobiota bacterium]